MKSLIKDFSGKCDQIHNALRISSHLLEKSLMENFILCACSVAAQLQITVLYLLEWLIYQI